MAKCLMGLEEGLAKVTLTLFVLSILTSAATTPVANASAAAILLSPNKGQAGVSVGVNGVGFKSSSLVFIKFDATGVATTFSSSRWGAYGDISATFIVPSVSPGTYNVTATDAKGDYAITTFTVTTELPTPTPTITPTSPEATAPHHTYQPTQSPVVGSAGFWSPLVIVVIVAAALTIIVPVTFVYRNRGKQETLLDKEPLPYRSELSTPTNKPTVTSRYNQPSTYGQQLTKPVVTNRSSQPSSYGQQPPFTKICPRCKRLVKEDYNLCPYCDKKLK